MKSNILSIINKIEGYKVSIKNFHWSSENMSEHKLCDDIADSISSNEDELSEVAQGLYGQIKKNEVKPISYKMVNTKKMLQDLLKDIESFYKTIQGEKEIGLRSVVENFISEINKFLYLIDFCIKEDYKKILKRKLNEGKEQKYTFTESEIREGIKTAIKNVLKEEIMDDMIDSKTHQKYNIGNGRIVEIDLTAPTLTLWENGRIIKENDGQTALDRIEYLINIWQERGGDFEDILRQIFIK